MAQPYVYSVAILTEYRPKVYSSKEMEEIKRSAAFKMYDAVPSSVSGAVISDTDKEIEKFLPLLKDYLSGKLLHPSRVFSDRVLTGRQSTMLHRLLLHHKLPEHMVMAWMRITCTTCSTSVRRRSRSFTNLALPRTSPNCKRDTDAICCETDNETSIAPAYLLS